VLGEVGAPGTGNMWQATSAEDGSSNNQLDLSNRARKSFSHEKFSVATWKVQFFCRLYALSPSLILTLKLKCE